ncbi:hypothetical protein P3T73_12505 [Kiritimatiellota bacterium B12222]|nr:hypothetical protein P3T73_12505 [Kiritimatiellota bacterium B12222]
MNKTKTTFSAKRNLTLGLLAVFGFGLTQMATASTLVYYRMGDDTSFVTDSSGNGNDFTAFNAVQTVIPATGDGSAFSSPIPQTGDSNSSMASFDGTQNMAAADPFGSLTSFTAEAYINLNSYSGSTQYVMSQWTTASNQRSWGIGVAASGGTGSASGNELYLLMGEGVGGSSVIPLGLTVTSGTDYYIAVGYDGTTGTNDIHFTYQNLSTAGSLVSSTISSGISTGINNSSATFRVGAYGSSAGSFWNGEIDEVRVSDTILNQNELLAVIPEPSSLALVVLFGGLFVVGIRRRR